MLIALRIVSCVIVWILWLQVFCAGVDVFDSFGYSNSMWCVSSVGVTLGGGASIGDGITLGCGITLGDGSSSSSSLSLS